MGRRVIQTILDTRRVDLGNVRARHRDVPAVLAALAQVGLSSLLHGVIVAWSVHSSTTYLLCRLEELLAILVNESMP